MSYLQVTSKLLFKSHDTIAFIGILCHFLPFSYFFNFFKHFLEHINGPLSGLFYRTDECSSEDLRGGAFSIRLQNCKVIS